MEVTTTAPPAEPPTSHQVVEWLKSQGYNVERGAGHGQDVFTFTWSITVPVSIDLRLLGGYSASGAGNLIKELADQAFYHKLAEKLRRR